jgi:hypothetical protein
MPHFAHGTFPLIKPPDFFEGNINSPPTLPSSWQATALLHPFSPPPHKGSQGLPFFQLCIANVSFIENKVLSIQVVGLDSGTWWYKITPSNTSLSIDKGKTWSQVDMGWDLPTTHWQNSSATYFKTSYLNWMKAQQVDWWKQPVPNSLATTWIWYDTITKLPFRMMFGAPPPTPEKGAHDQLAFFQNFSFTYFPEFYATNSPNIDTWQDPIITGFSFGNPDHQQLVVWDTCFLMTTFMTPVDSKSFPLPTAVLYQWKPDNEYRQAGDRAQATIMSYEYNPSAGFQTQVAQLYGVAPSSIKPTPPLAGQGYIYNETIFLVRGYPTPIVWSCDNIHLGQEPPDWARIPAVEGSIQAVVSNNKALCPNQNVNIISVLFPPAKEYPQGRYLWTWYSPFPGSDGTKSRPITFMESASTIAEGGTSLALADYFQYIPSPVWFPQEFFALPAICST